MNTYMVPSFEYISKEQTVFRERVWSILLKSAFILGENDVKRWRLGRNGTEKNKRA